MLPKKQQEQKQSIRCPYRGMWRDVHPDACQWHLDERDPECLRSGCKRYKKIIGIYSKEKKKAAPQINQNTFIK